MHCDNGQSCHNSLFFFGTFALFKTKKYNIDDIAKKVLYHGLYNFEKNRLFCFWQKRKKPVKQQHKSVDSRKVNANETDIVS